MAGEGLTGKQAKQVQDQQRKHLPAKGTVNPPRPAVTNMPSDPASASVAYGVKTQQQVHQAEIQARSLSAARSQEKMSAAQQKAAAQQLADRATHPDVIQRHIEFDQAHGITRDNTVYHKGYPICYRSKPAAPSIQVSPRIVGRSPI
jgi:hypothetical protein